MNFLIVIGLLLLAMLCWSLIVLAVYFALYSRRDYSGDQGLGFGLLAGLPWIALYFLSRKLQTIWRRYRYRQQKKRPIADDRKKPVLISFPFDIDPSRASYCGYCGNPFLRHITDKPGDLPYNYCSSTCAGHAP